MPSGLAPHVTEENASLGDKGPYQYTTEASTLGLPAGQWPYLMTTTMGNGMPFVRSTKKVQDGDLLYVRYRQSNGVLDLIVFND